MAAHGLAMIAGSGGRAEDLQEMYSEFEAVNNVRANAELPMHATRGERPDTITGAALGQIIANRAATFQSESIEPPAMHPDVSRALRDREWLEENEEFVEPDNLGHVECVVCKYGVFNEATQNTSMGYFRGMYATYRDTKHTPQMYTYMARFWNTELHAEYPHVPRITVSAVRYHVESCLRNENMFQRLQNNMQKL
jgi:hypothetical protein